MDSNLVHPPCPGLTLDEARLPAVREAREEGGAGLALRVHTGEAKLVGEDEDRLSALHWRAAKGGGRKEVEDIVQAM